MLKSHTALLASALALLAHTLPASGEDARFLENGSPAASSDGRQFVASPKATATDETDRTLYQVRCWQSGTLIIDENRWRVPQVHSTFAAFRDTPQARPGLYLLEFGHALCQVKAQGIADEAPVPATQEPPPPAKRR